MVIYYIFGPTASGKTATSLRLAKRINGEIINCDPFAFFKDCNILTAKPTKEELNQTPHHMVNILDITN